MPLATADWTVTFFDDFNGPVVNASSWNVAANYSRQGDLELYIPANVFVQNGSLVLRTVAEQFVLDGTTFNVTSGWVDMQVRLHVAAETAMQNWSAVSTTLRRCSRYPESLNFVLCRASSPSSRASGRSTRSCPTPRHSVHGRHTGCCRMRGRRAGRSAGRWISWSRWQGSRRMPSSVRSAGLGWAEVTAEARRWH